MRKKLWEPRWYERPYFSGMAILQGEAEQRFAPYFDIERYAAESGLKGLPRGWAVYLMTRQSVR